MKKYKIFYRPFSRTVAATLVALIPAENLKQALTRFNSAGFEGEILCIQNIDFDSSLFNL